MEFTEQKLTGVTLRFFEAYGKEIVYGDKETGTLEKLDNGDFQFTYKLDYIDEPFVRTFEYLKKKKLQFFNHKHHAEHGAELIHISYD